MDATAVQSLLTVGAGTGAGWVPGPQQAPARGSEGGGDTLTILTRAAEITLGWELKKKFLVSNYKPPVWKEHFVANLVPSKLLLFLRGKKKIRPFNEFFHLNSFFLS